MENEGMESYMK